MWKRVDRYKFADILGDMLPPSSGHMFLPWSRRQQFLRNVAIFVPDYTVSVPSESHTSHIYVKLFAIVSWKGWIFWVVLHPRAMTIYFQHSLNMVYININTNRSTLNWKVRTPTHGRAASVALSALTGTGVRDVLMSHVR
jgi:hypothetical protein